MASDDPELYAAKLRELELLKRKAALVKSNGLLFYKPYETQGKFHASTAKRRAFFAGNRTGKSTCGVAEDCAWLLGERPWLPEGDPARTSGIPRRPVKLLVLTIDWDKVDEIFTSERGDNPGKLWRYIPQDMVKSKRRNHVGVIDFIELKNGSTIYFDTVRAWLSNPNSVESSDHDAIHVDEPIPEQMWKGAARGLIDRGGCAWFTLTPLTEPWINDMFTSGREDHWYVRASIYDNPYLSRADIAMFEATLSEEEKQCRLLGQPLDKAGMVYKEFMFDRHVLKEIPKGWDSFLEPPKDYTYYVYIDPHPKTNHAVQFWAIPPGGHPRFCYDEIYAHPTIEGLCEMIKGRLDGRQLMWAKCDPWVFNEDPVSGLCYSAEFFTHGIPVERAQKNPGGAILKGQALLKEDPASVFFSPHMTETLYEFGHYVWAFHQGRPTNKPVDKDDHMMECFGRAVLDDLHYIDVSEAAAPLRWEEEKFDPRREMALDMD